MLSVAGNVVRVPMLSGPADCIAAALLQGAMSPAFAHHGTSVPARPDLL